MTRRVHLKLVRDAAAVATGASLLLAEAAEHHADASRVSFAAQNLRALRREAAAGLEQQQPEQLHSTSTAAWLARDAPQFPFLLGISPGDDPQKVFGAVLGGSQVALVGSQGESTLASLSALTAPVGAFECAANAVAQRWKALKAVLHADVPTEFDPRASALATTLDELLEALETIHGDAQEAASDPSAADENAGTSELPSLSEPAKEPFVVFFLRDFDDCDSKDAATWLRWVHRVTRAGLAHVVILTRAGVTPAKLAVLQTLHAEKDGEFVAIALRVATRAADATTAEDKVRELEAQYALGLRVGEPTLDERNEPSTIEVDDEVRVVVDSVGNWWSDLASVFERLAQRGLGTTADREERLALVRAVCGEYEQEVTAALLGQIHLNGSLDLQRIASRSSDARYDAGYDTPATVMSTPAATMSGAVSVEAGIDTGERELHTDAAEEKALRALEAWKCLEVVTGVAGKSGGSLTSPQQFLLTDKRRPPNCVQPVEALLPFGHRAEGEAKFLELIDERILFLRPKADVEIGVVPCAASDLLAPCWIETRPIVARAFKQIWRSDHYFNAVQELERISTNSKLREEIALYAQEIEERRQVLREQRGEFLLVQHKLTKAERSTRAAELSLLDLEIEAKCAYLDRLYEVLRS